MKTSIQRILFTAFVVVTMLPVRAQILKGEYLGQELPGKVPVIFAPGIISTKENELNSIFSCDGNEFYFSRGILGTNNKIYLLKRIKGVWSEPQLNHFSDGVDPHLSPDCSRMYYSVGADILFCEKMADGSWSEAKDPGGNINTPGRELYSCIVGDGSIYFQSTRPEGNGGSDIYRAQFKNGSFLPAVNIGDPVNTVNGEGDVFVTPDESIMIFSSSGRPDSKGAGDLYISFRQKDEKWSLPKNMGSGLNSPLHEYCPTMSHDGKFLFFTSRRNNNQGDIYWVSSKIFRSYK